MYVGTPRYQRSDAWTIASILQGETNGDPEAMQAVASVMANRAAQGGFGGGNILSVALAPNQFQGQAQPSPQALAVAQAALMGNLPDNTGGATYYANPSTSQASWARALNDSNAVNIGGNYFTNNTNGVPFSGVQTITPDNATDAMVPPSGALAAPTTADVTPTTPAAPQGPSGAPAMVNGIINNDPAAIQAGSHQIASDIQAGKISQNQVTSYFSSLPADVASAAKTAWGAGQDAIQGAVDAGIKAAAKAATDFGNTGFGGLLTKVATGIAAPKIQAGIDQANAGLAKGMAAAPSVSAWTTDWNKVAPTDPYSDANRQAVYGSLNQSLPYAPGAVDRSLGSVEPAPVSPAEYAGGAGFSNFTAPSPATNYVRPDASSVTPSPVTNYVRPDASSLNDPLAGRDPLTGALAAANPAAALTPDTGTGGLSNALAGVSTLAPPPQATAPQVPVPSAQPQPIRISYGANGSPDGRTYTPGGGTGGGGSFGGSGTNAWSAGLGAVSQAAQNAGYNYGIGNSNYSSLPAVQQALANGYEAPNFSQGSGGSIYAYKPDGQGGGTYVNSFGNTVSY